MRPEIQLPPPAPDGAGLPNLQRLLAAHRLPTAGWAEMRQPGYSGATLYNCKPHRGAAYVLKMTTARTDWVMRATSDTRCREAVIANLTFACDPEVVSPTIGSAADDGVFSILMRDISDQVLGNNPISIGQLGAVLGGVAHLHRQALPEVATMPWCSVEDRLRLLAPDPVRLADVRLAGDILHGWDRFFETAPADIGALVRSLFDDMQPLRSALSALPDALLHGDLKLDNIAIGPRGCLALLDWSMPMIAPAAIDIGWFLACNSRALPLSLDETLAAYTSVSSLDPSLRDRHEAMAALCGLLIRGWRKALDADAGEPAEIRWWCARAADAMALL